MYEELPWYMKNHIKNSKPRTGEVIKRVIEMVCNIVVIRAAQTVKGRGGGEIGGALIRKAYFDSFIPH